MSTQSSPNRSRIVLGVVVVAVIAVVAIVLTTGRSNDNPNALPSVVPRSPLTLTPPKGAKHLRTPSPGEVVVKINALEGTCWQGDIDGQPVKGCKPVAYELAGPPSSSGAYSATIRKTTANHDTLRVDIAINKVIIDSDLTSEPLGLVAVSVSAPRS